MLEAVSEGGVLRRSCDPRIRITKKEEEKE
jgi:hypothetical protein